MITFLMVKIHGVMHAINVDTIIEIVPLSTSEACTVLVIRTGDTTEQYTVQEHMRSLIDRLQYASGIHICHAPNTFV